MDILSLLLKNVNTLFLNGIKLILKLNDKIVPFIEILNELNNIILKRTKIKAKKSSQLLINDTLSSNNSALNLISLIQKDGILLSEENIKIIIKNEKNKFKYRICFIKSLAIKYIMIISQISQSIFHNSDEWIIKSVNMENEVQNEVINILKDKLNNKQLIDEQKEINVIEMDCFEKIVDEDDKFSNSNKSIDIKMKPIDNNSVINANRFYHRVNCDFIINDSFFDIKFEHLNPINKETQIKNKNDIDIIKNIDNDINQYKMILPKNNSWASELSEKSFMSNEEDIFKEEYYYYDINKFNEIYKIIEKFEIEKNVISVDNFFEVFIKEYIINNNEKKRYIKINLNEDNNNNNDKSNEEKNVVLVEYNAISDALKNINYKQIKRLISIYQINIEKKDEDKDKKYNDYIKLNEIFTILSLIGNEILTNEKENEIMNFFKEKLMQGKYLDKKEFINYKFWFEKSFEYQNNSNYKKKDEQNEYNISIKDFIFDLWKDESGNYIDFKRFIEVLKIINYITDFTEYSYKRYYEVIFYEN
jgi:hypothetical protein